MMNDLNQPIQIITLIMNNNNVFSDFPNIFTNDDINIILTYSTFFFSDLDKGKGKKRAKFI